MTHLTRLKAGFLWQDRPRNLYWESSVPANELHFAKRPKMSCGSSVTCSVTVEGVACSVRGGETTPALSAIITAMQVSGYKTGATARPADVGQLPSRW